MAKANFKETFKVSDPVYGATIVTMTWIPKYKRNRHGTDVIAGEVCARTNKTNYKSSFRCYSQSYYFAEISWVFYEDIPKNIQEKIKDYYTEEKIWEIFRNSERVKHLSES